MMVIQAKLILKDQNQIESDDFLSKKIEGKKIKRKLNLELII